MFTRHTQGSLTWIDALNPTTEEIHSLMTECDMPPEFMNDLTSMSPRTETIARKNALKVVLDFPIVKRTDINHPHEVKFIATKTHLLTVRFEDIEAIHRFGKEFEIKSALIKKKDKATGAHVFLTLIGAMYTALDKKIDYLEAKLSDIEHEIFAEREKAMVFEISNLSRRIINFRQVLNAHDPALKDLHEGIQTAFGKAYAPYVDSLQEHHGHLRNRISALANTLTDMRETNLALLTTKQNEIMKILTIVAFVTFPLTLITSLLSMPTADTPLIGIPGDFWIITGSMGFVCIGLFGYFYFKKWL